MSSNTNINFDKAVRLFARTNHPDFKLNENGIYILCEKLNFFNKTLLKEFEENYDKANKLNQSSFLLFAKSAIEKIFGPDLKTGAIAEAQMQLMLFQCGCLKYPGASEPVVKREIGDHQMRHLKTGVSKLQRNTNNGLILEQSALCMLSKNLLEYMKMVTAKVCSTSANKQELQPIDFKNVLPYFVNEDIQKLAYSEGNRSLMLYNNGLLTFVPVKPMICPAYDSSSQETFSRESIKSIIKMCLSRHETDIDPSGLKYLSHILTTVAEYLSLKTALNCERNEEREMDFTHLNRVVTDTFSGQLNKHALMNGYVDVENYHKGDLEYKKPSRRIKSSEVRTKSSEPPPKKRVKTPVPKPKSPRYATRSRKTNMKKQAQKKPEAKKGTRRQPVKKVQEKNGPLLEEFLPSLSNSLFPTLEVTVDPSAITLIDTIVLSVCNKLISLSADADANVVNSETILSGLDKLFPPQLSQQAKAYLNRQFIQRFNAE